MKNKFLFTALVFALVATLSLTGCAKSLTPEEIAQQALDGQALQKAISARNLDLCAAIQDQKTKEICEMTISEQKLKNEIVVGMDLLKCAQLKSEGLKKACEVEINAAIKAKEEDKRKYDEVMSFNRRVNEIVASGDGGKCATLEKQYWVNICKASFKK
ncbi:MAG: hypothetical protein US89_C0005G0035 [Candidatus Peregrinibacteria bacterium GW2011_GWF2_38_29]|nr:MAG: hypothetical protein US89_C0005G0035 [Candidatus Peregrinibacteria bacterium GW2011_GWF2_38_29]HBB02622.1 hypothetical protein [Candidatus Peregrinibacteria bacterium]